MNITPFDFPDQMPIVLFNQRQFLIDNDMDMEGNRHQGICLRASFKWLVTLLGNGVFKYDDLNFTKTYEKQIADYDTDLEDLDLLRKNPEIPAPDRIRTLQDRAFRALDKWGSNGFTDAEKNKYEIAPLQDAANRHFQSNEVFAGFLANNSLNEGEGVIIALGGRFKDESQNGLSDEIIVHYMALGRAQGKTFFFDANTGVWNVDRAEDIGIRLQAYFSRIYNRWTHESCLLIPIKSNNIFLRSPGDPSIDKPSAAMSAAELIGKMEKFSRQNLAQRIEEANGSSLDTPLEKLESLNGSLRWWKFHLDYCLDWPTSQNRKMVAREYQPGLSDELEKIEQAIAKVDRPMKIQRDVLYELVSQRMNADDVPPMIEEVVYNVAPKLEKEIGRIRDKIAGEIWDETLEDIVDARTPAAIAEWRLRMIEQGSTDEEVEDVPENVIDELQSDIRERVIDEGNDQLDDETIASRVNDRMLDTDWQQNIKDVLFRLGVPVIGEMPVVNPDEGMELLRSGATQSIREKMQDIILTTQRDTFAKQVAQRVAHLSSEEKSRPQDKQNFLELPKIRMVGGQVEDSSPSNSSRAPSSRVNAATKTKSPEILEGQLSSPLVEQKPRGPSKTDAEMESTVLNPQTYLLPDRFQPRGLFSLRYRFKKATSTLGRFNVTSAPEQVRGITGDTAELSAAVQTMTNVSAKINDSDFQAIRDALTRIGVPFEKSNFDVNSLTVHPEPTDSIHVPGRTILCVTSRNSVIVHIEGTEVMEISESRIGQSGRNVQRDIAARLRNGERIPGFNIPRLTSQKDSSRRRSQSTNKTQI